MKDLNIFDDVKSKNSTEIYHASGEIIKKPEIREVKYFKDFGYGFYTTIVKKQAENWSLRKANPTVNIYTLDLEYKDRLNNKIFETMTEEWLDFIVFCRRGGKHNFDTVEGPMTDDTIFNFISGFMRGEISRVAFWELCKFKYPTHQLLLSTEKSLEYIKYKECYYV